MLDIVLGAVMGLGVLTGVVLYVVYHMRKAKRKPVFVTKYGTKVFNDKGLPRINQTEIETMQDAMIEVYGRRYKWDPKYIKAAFGASEYNFVPSPIVLLDGTPAAGLSLGLHANIAWAQQLHFTALAHESLHGLRQSLSAVREADENAHINWTTDDCYGAITEVNNLVATQWQARQLKA